MLSNVYTDTSEYPSNHSWICFAQDESLSPDVLDIIQGAADAGSRTILDMVNKLLTSLAKKVLSTKMKTSITEDLYEDSDGGSTAEDDESVYNGHSDDEDFGGQFGITALNSNVDFDLSVMKRYALYLLSAQLCHSLRYFQRLQRNYDTGLPTRPYTYRC